MARSRRFNARGATVTIGLLFWILMIFAFFFDVWWHYPPEGGSRAFGFISGRVLIFALIFLLGWHDFGPPVHDDGTATYRHDDVRIAR